MKDDVKKLERTVGHITEEVKQTNDKVADEENKIEVMDKELETFRSVSPCGLEGKGILRELERYPIRN